MVFGNQKDPNSKINKMKNDKRSYTLLDHLKTNSNVWYLAKIDEGLKITIRRSKTDQFGEGMIKGLPYFSNKDYCPVSHLKKWIDLSQIKL